MDFKALLNEHGHVRISGKRGSGKTWFIRSELKSAEIDGYWGLEALDTIHRDRLRGKLDGKAILVLDQPLQRHQVEIVQRLLRSEAEELNICIILEAQVPDVSDSYFRYEIEPGASWYEFCIREAMMIDT